MKIKIKNTSEFKLPEYKTIGSVGLDLQANIINSVILSPLERIAIPTGIFIELVDGIEAQIRPRSGLSLKDGLTAILGTIDSDYRGEIKVILINLNNNQNEIKHGDRIAQMVFNKIEKIEWELTNELNETKRGQSGFGSTGKR